MRVALPLGVLAAIVLATSSAGAATRYFEANLDGLQEVPPNASPAFGFVDLTLDDVSGNVSLTTGTYQDLLGGSTSVFLQGLANAGTNAPILFALTLDAPGTTAGTISGSGTLGAGDITGMINSQTYINIRTPVFPSGEIRGQLLEVPEPASLGLLALTVPALLARRRR
jgi:CHRD domain